MAKEISWEDFIVVVPFIGCIVVQIGIALAAVVAWCRSKASLSFAFKLPSWLQDPLADKDPKVRAIVQKSMLEYHLRFQRAWVNLCGILFMIPAAMFARQILMGEERSGPYSRVFVFMLGFMEFTLCRAFPGIMNDRTHFLTYLSAIAIVTGWSCPMTGATREVVMLLSNHSRSLTLILSFQTRFKVTWPFNTVHDCLQILSYALADPAGIEVTTADFATQIFYTYWQKTMALWIVDRLLLLSVMRMVEAKQERGLRVAFLSLLGQICDAVVELDGDHRMVQHEPRLAQVLLHGMGKSLEGAMLQDFIPETRDKEQLAKSLSCASGEEGTHAGMFHMIMKDAMGSKIKMQCFHITFSNLGGVRHLMGLLEESDEKIFGKVETMTDTNAVMSDRLFRRIMHSANENNISDSDAESSVPSGASHAGLANGDPPVAISPDALLSKEVCVQVRIAGEHLVVLWSSLRFQTRYGLALVGTSDFGDWLPHGKADFLKQVKDRVAAIWAGTAEPGVMEYGNLLVQPMGEHLASRRRNETPRKVVVVFPPLPPKRVRSTDGATAADADGQAEYPITILVERRTARPAAASSGAGGATQSSATIEAI